MPAVEHHYIPLPTQNVEEPPLVTAGSLGTGAPGGLFTPSITYGALFGGAMGDFWSLLCPGTPTGCYATLGAAAVLAATMQAPLAATVLILELTGNHMAMTVPILLTITTAAITTRFIDARSIESGPASVQPFIDRIGHSLQHTAFDDLIAPFTNIVSSSTSYDKLLELFNSDPALKYIYVIDHQGILIGSLARDRLLDAEPLVRIINIGAVTDLCHTIIPIFSDQDRKSAVALLQKKFNSTITGCRSDVQRIFGGYPAPQDL